VINPNLKTVGTILTMSDGKDVLLFYSALALAERSAPARKRSERTTLVGVDLRG
jgi:hypothetical protein